jgi:DNA ligase-associated metallophosphoesterase
MLSIAGSIPIEFGNEQFTLLPDRAVYWHERQTLLIADAHLGKAATFRAFGVPVPSGSTAKDLSRLTRLLEITHARRLVILGDLVHAKAGRQPEVESAVASWRSSHEDVEMILVRGNHDRASGRIPGNWRMTEVEEPFEDNGFVLTHDPPCDSELPTFAGHVHPSFHVIDFDGSTITMPCFVIDARCTILPAFGTFTGGHKIQPQPGREIYLVAPDRVVRLSTPQPSRV